MGGGGDYYKSDPESLETLALNSQFVFGPCSIQAFQRGVQIIPSTSYR